MSETGGAARRFPTWGMLILGMAHSVLLAAAFAPVGWWGASLVAAAPLAMVGVLGRDRAKRAALLASIGAIPFWAFEQQWVMAVSAVGYWPLVAYLSLHAGLVVWAVALVTRAWPGLPAVAWLPVVWVGVEFLRGSVLWHGYPWYLVGHPLIDAPGIPGLATVVGAYGVSAWAALVSGAMVDAALRRRVAAGAGISAALALGVFGAFLLPSGESGERVRIGVVQTNVPQDNKTAWTIEQRERDFVRFVELTLSAAERDPDLIVWPETMFPGTWIEPIATDGGEPLVSGFTTALLEVQAETGISMVVGAVGAEGLRVIEDVDGARIEAEREFNSAFVVAGGRVLDERYDKVHLTPFGEVMPYISHWPWLERQLMQVGARGMSFGLSAGEELRVLEAPTAAGRVRVATPICFEATSSWVCRRLVFEGGRRADVIVNLTNDGWFGWFDAGRRQHMQAARWRCVELATPMVRAANTGVSAVIDARGRVLTAGVEGGQARADGVLVWDVPLGSDRTVYSFVGDSFGWFLLAWCAGLVGWAIIKVRRLSDRVKGVPAGANADGSGT